MLSWITGGHPGASVGLALLLSLALGMVHGITPDEHTWPITFSYAVGTYTARGGLVIGLVFSLAFTVQRAIMSELAYLGLGGILSSPRIDNPVYVVVGIAMAVAGYRARQHALGRLPEGVADRPIVSPYMAAVHGLIAGFGVGAFALVLYTVLAPQMPGPAYGFLPGAAFGIGTLLVQAPAGALFGAYLRRLRLPEAAIRKIAARTSGETLYFGGYAFFLAGLLGILWPAAASWRIPTGIAIPNLDSINLGLVLVVVVVLGIGLSSLWRAVRSERLRIERGGVA